MVKFGEYDSYSETTITANKMLKIHAKIFAFFRNLNVSGRFEPNDIVRSK